MSVVEKYANPIPKMLGVRAITLSPFILYAEAEDKILKTLRQHKREHITQVQEDGCFAFYISYFIYWFAGLVRYRSWNQAYRAIPYEVEARNAEYWG